MIVDVEGLSAHAATGGVQLGDEGPVLLLIHGAGMDSTVWQLQTRFLAYRRIRTLAVDLPGHGRSEGEPLATIADMAAWVAHFLDAAGLGDIEGGVNVAGHSMGTFIALQLATDYPEKVASLVLLGAANAMPVHPDLVDAAANDLPTAASLMAAWGHDRHAHIGLNPTPGLWMLGGARALVENSTPGVLTADFAACVAFTDAEANASKTTCPVTVVIGSGDKMTPPRAGRALAAALSDPTVIELADTGHTMMLENPRPIRSLLLAAVTTEEDA
jgi:pimeloyl-ACP methyl ester carboxylesterase